MSREIKFKYGLKNNNIIVLSKPIIIDEVENEYFNTNLLLHHFGIHLKDIKDFTNYKLTRFQSAGWSVKDEAGNDVEVYYDSTLLKSKESENIYYISKDKFDNPTINLIGDEKCSTFLSDINDKAWLIAIGTLQENPELLEEKQ
jgi:hypothetical protein